MLSILYSISASFSQAFSMISLSLLLTSQFTTSSLTSFPSSSLSTNSSSLFFMSLCLSLAHLALSMFMCVCISCFAVFLMFSAGPALSTGPLSEVKSISISTCSRSVSSISSSSFSKASSSSSTLILSISTGFKSFLLIPTITLTISGVLVTSIPDSLTETTGSSSWLTPSDKWSFWPPPAEHTGLVGGAPPISTVQSL